MNTRAIIVLVLAVVCGIAAAIGTSRLQGSGGSDTVPVIIAKFDISRGTMVTKEMLETRQWPANMAQENAVSSYEEAVDRVAVVQILQGDTVLDGKLASRDSGRGLAPLIPKGMRAYTIQTSKIASNVAGFILPGNRVDVILTLRGTHNDGTGGGSATTLLQAVEILAIDQNLDAPAENKTEPTELRSVTLLVDPRQVTLLDLGQNLGQLTLSLRNPEDTEEAITEPATLAGLRFRQESPVKDGEGTSVIEGIPSRRTGTTYKIRTLRGSYSGEISVSTQ